MIGAVIEGAAQVGCRKGIVDHERDLVLVSDLGDCLDVEDVGLRVADDLAVEKLGFRRHRAPKALRIGGVDEMNLDAETLEGERKLVVGTAIERVRRHHLVASLKQRGDGRELRCLARSAGQRADTALQTCDALLEGARSRVGNARIDVAELVQGEQVRSVVGVLEDVGSGLIDRHGTRAGRRIWHLAGVQHQRVESKVEFLGHESLPRACRG